MLVLSRSEIERLLTMTDAIDAVERAFRLLSSGEVAMPQRAATAVAEHDALHLSMPAYLRSAADAAATNAVLAVKVVTVYPHNMQRHGLPMVQGAILLHDAKTGALLALMDAEYVTVMRTGAAAGVATRLLAIPDASTLLLFGAGALAFPVAEAVCAVRPIRQIRVHSRSGERDAALCARLQERLAVRATPVTVPELPAAVAEAQVICTATTSNTPLFDGTLLQPGTHINALGAYRSTMRELDSSTILRSRVLVDQRAAAAAEAGDILLACAEHPSIHDPIAGELGEALLGRLSGRTSPDEVTLFKSVGLAVQDAATAAHVYRAAVAQGLGTPAALDA